MDRTNSAFLVTTTSQEPSAVTRNTVQRVTYICKLQFRVLQLYTKRLEVEMLS